MSIFWKNKKIFCLITGASRGIGKRIATKFAEYLGRDSVLLLTARNHLQLESVRSEILGINRTISVRIAVLDLEESTEVAFNQLLLFGLDGADSSIFEAGIIVHNAGSLGQISNKLIGSTKTSDLGKHFNINLMSTVSLNGLFLQNFAPVQEKLVINISSLAALWPCPGVGLYCTAKAAREMYFKCLAIEEPNVRILNYAPGDVETDMLRELVEKCHDRNVREETKKIMDGNGNIPLLTVDEAVERLVEILKENKFKNGEHVDYHKNTEELYGVSQ